MLRKLTEDKCLQMYNLKVKGSVIFAGAGSGDPELITVKASRAIAAADIIISDRLVAENILTDYAKSSTEIIRVGKQAGKVDSMPQAAINSLLVNHALAGKKVVRLKGGDVSIFSNIYDELLSLVENSISYEIIPGISAASAAAAYTGIPLTARNHSTAVRFLTAYDTAKISEDKWQELATTEDTLVFFMSSDAVDLITLKLITFGISKQIHIAIIEQASTPDQQTTACNIHDYPGLYKNIKYASPSLIIIGKVAALNTKFAWFEERAASGIFFKEIGNSEINSSLSSLKRKYVNR